MTTYSFRNLFGEVDWFMILKVYNICIFSYTLLYCIVSDDTDISSGVVLIIVMMAVSQF